MHPRGAYVQISYRNRKVANAHFYIYRVFSRTAAQRDAQIGKDAPLNCKIPILGTEACAEAMLDIEYIKSLGGKQNQPPSCVYC